MSETAQAQATWAHRVRAAVDAHLGTFLAGCLVGTIVIGVTAYIVMRDTKRECYEMLETYGIYPQAPGSPPHKKGEWIVVKKAEYEEWQRREAEVRARMPRAEEHPKTDLDAGRPAAEGGAVLPVAEGGAVLPTAKGGARRP